ncbi:hypothetical protein C8A05DRAFT_46035 [Staphylotrichum tortipilum]|uniref:SET domain-containing protein n=1 Tax=Staphylotrichum tortipilum TaxID=2831512 RepID=A0AAN6RR94_9PEZI|nr:hypothetical protein C8A05DRAFT_46035 [Staphylotrichum longicolle]
MLPLITLLLSFCSPTIASPPSPKCARSPPPHPFHASLTTCLSPHSSFSHFPWTHPPYCLPPISPSLPPYCVFTHAALFLSLITTPDFASTTFLNPFLHFPPKPFFAPARLAVPRPYAVRDFPGKGKGAVATRNIAKGTAVLVDRVSVLSEAEFPPGVGGKEVEGLLEVAVRRLGEPERVRGLARRGGRGMGVVEEVVLTNSFGVEVGGRGFMGLFVDVARFNHACKPNAFIHFSPTTLSMTIWAARDIKPGEEITITYSAAGMTSKERLETLEKVWGFACTCSLCTSSTEELGASDANREEIRSLQEKVIDLAQQGQFRKSVAAAERMFSLIEEEGLTEQMGDMYEVPAQLYYRIGDLYKALEYFRKARHEIDGYGVAGKLGEEKIRELEELIQQIEREMEKKRTRKAKAKVKTNRKR